MVLHFRDLFKRQVTTLKMLPNGRGLHNTPTASLQRSKTQSPKECSGYDIKQFDGEVPVMHWGKQNIPTLPLLPGPLWPGVVEPDRVRSMSQTDLFNI